MAHVGPAGMRTSPLSAIAFLFSQKLTFVFSLVVDGFAFASSSVLLVAALSRASPLRSCGRAAGPWRRLPSLL